MLHFTSFVPALTRMPWPWKNAGGGGRGQTARKHNTLPDPVGKRRRPNPRATAPIPQEGHNNTQPALAHGS